MEYDKASMRWVGGALGKYKCLKCNYEWEEKHGPNQCPKCNNLYVKWLNFEEMKENNFK